MYRAYFLFFITTGMSLNLKKRVKFLSNQCSFRPSNSTLPSELKLLKEHTLTSSDFPETDIFQKYNNQDSNKAHGHDLISIGMLKLCESI